MASPLTPGNVSSGRRSPTVRGCVASVMADPPGGIIRLAQGPMFATRGRSRSAVARRQTGLPRVDLGEGEEMRKLSVLVGRAYAASEAPRAASADEWVEGMAAPTLTGCRFRKNERAHIRQL